MTYAAVTFYDPASVDVPVVPMNPVVRDMWVDALESGDYPQGRGRLVAHNLETDTRRFCCLGVLCELAVHAGILRYVPRPNSYHTYVNGEQVGIDSAVLPEVVARWAGLPSSDPRVWFAGALGTRRLVRLSYLNDNHALSFPAIAAAIRESL